MSNKIGVLLFSLSKLSQLQHLDVSDNELELKSIGVVGEIPSLTKLNLNLCRLKELPQR